MLRGLGWLDPNSLKRWQCGQVDCLQDVLQVTPARLVEAMGLLRSWAMKKGLSASSARHVARTPQRQPLRFIRRGDGDIEAEYHTRWVSPDLSGKQREDLNQKADRPPELVVIQPVNDEWTCHRCGGTGNLLITERPDRHAWSASASAISNSCQRAMRCSRGERKPEVRGTLSSYASAGAVAAMNVRGFWSSRRFWPRLGARSRRDGIRNSASLWRRGHW
jgi:hypothetical protein